MKKSQLWAGVLAPPIALGGIGAAILINRSWWRLTDNAISDLGKVGLPHSWVMNIPLFISALLAIYYAAGLFDALKHPVSKMGVLVFTIGLAFLAGIALFPEGTEPHYYVSWGFFLCASIGFLITGLGFWLAGKKRFGTFTVLLFVLEVAMARWALNAFRGVAIAEFIGIFAVLTWHYALIAMEFQGAGFFRD